ncbi:hypothetical protein [Blastococcus goldschmidtiae]|uniref:Uncharacterized protein n=1 Tax=Blastococcus goldschmidtiae TaxID=3075546 RepID=A0ABU2K2X4_9ACTN|nr:hypothetical protein [Blastococcus sp. DSM 46792]MDT0274538.1 hypothetical protein [Blastococcus sp. DSM 46792]
MTSRSRVRTTVLACVLVAGVTGCADAGKGPTRPPAGGEDLVVDDEPLEVPALLDPVPDGLMLTELSYDPPGSYLLYNETSGRYEPSRATLYGNPDLADTLDGPVLLVGTSTGSATIAGPGYEAPGEEVDLGGGRTGRVVPDADRVWVVIEHNDYTEFVVGRGIDEDELVAAARGADFESGTAALAPDDVPAGLEPLVAGSPQDRPGGGSGERMFFQGSASYLSVYAVRADPRLAALWGFWIEDASGTEVRGHPGSAGDLQGANVGDPEARGRVWAEDGMVVAVVLTMDGDGDREEDSDRLLDQVVDNLRVGTWEEFEALDGEVRTRPPTREEAGCGLDGGFVSGVEGAIRWAFQLTPGSVAGRDEWLTCFVELASGGGGSTLVPAPVGELVVDAMGSSSGAGGIGSTALGGVAPPDTARVTVTTADGRALLAQLADQGPRSGERVWGAYLLQVPPSAGGPPLTVTAYDAAGAVLDSTPV